MKIFNALIIAAAALFVFSSATNAGFFLGDDGPTLIWVKIKAKRGEALWQACRRVYQRDVYQVRRGPGNTIWCNIDHSRIYSYGERRQNFNLR